MRILEQVQAFLPLLTIEIFFPPSLYPQLQSQSSCELMHLDMTHIGKIISKGLVN